MKERLVVFDVLRIVAISLIVVCHIYGWFSLPSPGNICTLSTMQFNLFYWGVGAMMVSLLVFVSGAMIEYSYGKKDNLDSGRFLMKRAIRLYPAYWITMALTIISVPALLYASNPIDFTAQVLAVKSFTMSGVGSINGMGFFIGLIMVLYAFYPMITKYMKKYPLYSLSTLAIITFGLRYLIGVFDLNKYQLTHFNVMIIERWLPFCNMFMFGLGILIIQKKWYPGMLHTNKYLAFISEFTFYVFLVHALSWIYPISKDNLLIYFTMVFLISYILMIVDKIIQKKLNA